MDKEEVVYLYTLQCGISIYNYADTNKIEILPLATTWRDLEGIILCEKDKDKYSVITYIWNIKYKTSEWI